MNWTPEVKPLIEKYSRGHAWLLLYKDFPSQKETFQKMEERMKEIRKELVDKDVTLEQICEVEEKTQKIMDKKESEMSEREIDFVMQIVWGKDVQIMRMPKDGEKIILAVYKMKPSGVFFSTSEIASFAKLPTADVLKTLKELEIQKRGILKNRDYYGNEKWAISWKKREELLEKGVDKVISE